MTNGTIQLNFHQDFFILLPGTHDEERQIFEAAATVDLGECGFEESDLSKLQKLAQKLELALLANLLQTSSTSSVRVSIQPKLP